MKQSNSKPKALHVGEEHMYNQFILLFLFLKKEVKTLQVSKSVKG